MFPIISTCYIVLDLLYASDLVSFVLWHGWQDFVYIPRQVVHNLSKRDIWGATHRWDGIQSSPISLPGHPSPLLHPSHYIEQSRLFMLQIYRYTNTEKNKYKKWKYTLRKYTHPTCLLSGNPPGSVALHMGPHPSHYRASQSAKEGPQHVFQPTTLDFDDGPQRQRPTTCIPTTQTLMLCYVWVPCK